MHLLRGAVRTYAWCADRDCRFHRKAKSQRIREAELWLGAPGAIPPGCRQTTVSNPVGHPGGRPGGTLGAAVCGRFGDTLPFLVKVLAADEPLSLQAHPSAQQAVEGFGREECQGIAVSSPVRNYRDRSQKAELRWHGVSSRHWPGSGPGRAVSSCCAR